MTIFKTLLVALMATMTIAQAGGDIAPAMEPIVVVEPADKNAYVGISTIVGVTDPDNINWFGYTTLGVQAGYTVLRSGNWETAVEARYNTDTANFFDTYNYGAYVKPGYNFGNAQVYGLVGYQDGHTNGFTDFEGELGYGGGVLTTIYDLEVFADYLYGDKTQSEVVTVGLNYRF